jgi:hypothetical protein
MRMIPVAGPSITKKEIDYVAEATAGAWYEDAGRFKARFERAFADYVSARHANYPLVRRRSICRWRLSASAPAMRWSCPT